MSATLHWREGKQAGLQVFTDSGAVGNFIDGCLVRSLGLPLEVLPCPLPISALHGQTLA